MLAILMSAGLSEAEARSVLPHLVDLARVTGRDMATVTRDYIASLHGPARLLKRYGMRLRTGAD